MPRGRKPEGETALSSAERQARYRARQTATPTTRRDHAAHPQTAAADHDAGATAVAELLALQAEYAAWSDALPDSLRDSATAMALQEIVDLDLEALAAIQPPRGYGRD